VHPHSGFSKLILRMRSRTIDSNAIEPTDYEFIAADVRQFSYLINTDEVFGTHSSCRWH